MFWFTLSSIFRYTSLVRKTHHDASDWEELKSSTPQAAGVEGAGKRRRVDDDGRVKKKKPAPKRESRAQGRSSSANDVTMSEPEDPMHSAIVKRFGQHYGDVMQSFLMTQVKFLVNIKKSPHPSLPPPPIPPTHNAPLATTSTRSVAYHQQLR